jgi:hypothetical protein
MDKLIKILQNDINTMTITVNGTDTIELQPSDIARIKSILNSSEYIKNLQTSINGTLTNIAGKILKGGNMDNSIYNQMNGNFINSDYSEVGLNNDLPSLTLDNL